MIIWRDILAEIDVLLVVINATIFILSLAGNGKAFKLFTWYLILMSLVQVTSSILAEATDNNLFMSNVYLLIQFIVLTLFYKELLHKKILIYIGALVVLFLGYQYISDPGLFLKYNPIDIALTQGLIAIYALLYFYISLNRKKAKFLIINVGVFVYLVGSTLIFASGNLVFNMELISKDNLILLLILNCIFYIVYQLMVFIDWYKNFRIPLK